MKITKQSLNDIQEMLRNAEYPIFANLLSNYLIKHENKDNQIIGFVGDDLVGKSTIINMILGKKILPTSVIPSSAEITLKYGEKETILTGEAEKKNLTELIEEEDSVEITVASNYLKNNSIIIKEFHGLINKQKFNNLALMSEIYKCDVIVIVVSAEHLFSESECLFMKNYIHYVGTNRLFVAINKLSLVVESDIEHVLEYVKKQMLVQFPNVKWSICDSLDRKIVARYTNRNIKEEIPLLISANREPDDNSIRNMLGYIKEQLQKDVDVLEKVKLKGLEEIKHEKKKLTEKKNLEIASVEEALIEFKQKRNEAIEQLDNFIKRQFEIISTNLLDEFVNSTNKYMWYEKELDTNWRKAVSDVSNQTNKFAYKTILKDIEWINEILQTKLGLDPISLQISSRKMKGNEKLVPYETYRKYMSIGIGGGVVIGYSLFRIVGAVISIGGGVLAYSYLGMKDTVQTEEIKKEISSNIRDVSIEVRKISKKDVEMIYDNMTTEFEREARNIIDSKYKFVNINEFDQQDKMDKIQKVINYIEEV